MSLTWSALPIAPNEDFDGAPLLRTEFGLEEGHGQATRAVSARHRPRGFRGLSQRAARHRRRPEPRVEQLRVAAALSQLRRDLTPSTQVRTRHCAGQWLVSRTLGWSGGSAFYGKELAALAQLEIEFSDGYVQTVVTDKSWRAGPSAVVSNDLYDGQTIDARRHSDAWLQSGFSDEAWTGVHPVELDFSTLTPYIGPPVRRQEELRTDQDLDLPGRQDAGRFRAEPGRLDYGSACRARPARLSRSVMPRCWSTMNWGSGPLRTAEGYRSLHPQWWRRRVRADVHLSRLPLRRGRRLAG